MAFNWNYTFVGAFKEMCGEGFPAFKALKLPDAQKEKVLRHMKKAKELAVAAGVFRDCFTDEYIHGDALMLTDGKYAWRSDVQYYFEKYDLQLPDDFIEYALTT